MLAQELRARVSELLAHMTAQRTGAFPAVQMSARKKMLAQDAMAADFVETLGKSGKKYADILRTRASQRWTEFEGINEEAGSGSSEGLLHIWQPDRDSGIIRFVLALATVVWEDIVKARLEKQRSSPPAVSIVVTRDLAGIHRKGNVLVAEDATLRGPDGRELCTLASPLSPEIPQVDATILGAMRKGVGLLRTLPAHRLLRYEVCTAHAQRLEEQGDFRTIRVEGGWQGLAKVVGCGSSHVAADQLKAIVQCQAHLCFKWPDGTCGNLVTYRVQSAGGRRPALLVLTVGDILLPGVVQGFNQQTRKGREARQLVPLPPLPPFVGRPQDWGPQANLQMLALCEFVSNSQELITSGGISISERRWRELAEKGGIPPKTWGRVLEAWHEGNDETPPFLKSLGNSLVTLSDAHQGILEFLVAGAKRRVGGRKAGQEGRKRRESRFDQRYGDGSPR